METCELLTLTEVVEELMSYLCYLCLFAYSDVQDILCCLLRLVYPMLPVSLDYSFLIAPSVFSNVYLSCVLCTLCYQFLWIVHFLLPLRYYLTFICLVSCVPYVDNFSGLSVFDCPFGFLYRLFIYTVYQLSLLDIRNSYLTQEPCRKPPNQPVLFNQNLIS